MGDVIKAPSPTKCQDIIPFVFTYNPSLPNIGNIINQNWNLLKYSKSKSVGQMFNCKPAYKRLSNLQGMLVHSQLNRTVNAGSVSKCNRPRCSHCLSIV